MTAPLDVMDRYTRRARYKPALVVVLPLGLAILSWSSDGLKSLAPIWSFLVWAGGTALLAQLARDRGKRKEPTLFQSWGGKPTSRLLRYRNSENAVLVERRHGALQKAIPALHIANREEELADPQRADETYDAAVKWLLEQTRDQKRFGMLFDENCNYGFRRNLWGMKPFGVMCALIGLAATAWVVIDRGWSAAVIPIVAGACSGVMILFWIFWCNPEWVRLAADAYAERLLAATDTLVVDRSPKKKAAASETKQSEAEGDQATKPVKRQRKRQPQPDVQP